MFVEVLDVYGGRCVADRIDWFAEAEPSRLRIVVSKGGV